KPKKKPPSAPGGGGGSTPPGGGGGTPTCGNVDCVQGDICCKSDSGPICCAICCSKNGGCGSSRRDCAGARSRRRTRLTARVGPAYGADRGDAVPPSRWNEQRSISSACTAARTRGSQSALISRSRCDR